MNRTTEQQGITLSLTGESLAWGATVFHHDASHLQQLPELPDADMVLTQCYLPMEWLLVRDVHFPFASPAMVDADMLVQELSDRMDMEADEWWLTWHLERSHDGVAGMVFGLPESLRQSMQDDSRWGQSKQLLVDGYEQLNGALQQVDERQQGCAILLQDSEGIFFGFFDGQAWRGMRRINGTALQLGDLFQLTASLQAMGLDSEQQPLLAHADEALLQQLSSLSLNLQATPLATLPSRHEANLALPHDGTAQINFRHGRWSAQAAWRRWSLWQRSATLAAMLLVAWGISTWQQLHTLDTQLVTTQQRIEAAFHQGLPHETVMLDAMAQLRKAAGTGPTQSSDHFLSDLAQIGRIYQAEAWTLDNIALRDGGMDMSGSVKNIEHLNAIQSQLQQALEREVRIVDTNIAGEQVSFRMHW